MAEESHEKSPLDKDLRPNDEKAATASGATDAAKAGHEGGHDNLGKRGIDDREPHAEDRVSDREHGGDREHGQGRAAAAGAADGAGASKLATTTDGEGRRESRETALSRENEKLRTEHADHRRSSLAELELARTKNRRSTDLGLLLLRVLPVIMIMHGIHKAQGFSAFQQTVAANPVGGIAAPVFSVMVVLGQICLPILIAIGLFTRLAALLEAVMMACIWAFMFLIKGWIDQKTGGINGESALSYVMLTLPLVFTGAGRFSIDHIIGRSRARSRAESRAERKAAKV